ncbi:MAG: hypothetical protein WBE26_08360, partial [Phycisphaerae bacterium]
QAGLNKMSLAESVVGLTLDGRNLALIQCLQIRRPPIQHFDLVPQAAQGAEGRKGLEVRTEIPNPVVC